MLSFLRKLLRKPIDPKEAINDYRAFECLNTSEGDRVLQNIALRFGVFDYVFDVKAKAARSKTEYQAGFDDGVRAVLTYIETQRETYHEQINSIEERMNDDRGNKDGPAGAGKQSAAVRSAVPN